MVRKGDMMNIDDIIEILAVDLIGVVPDDETIIVSTNRGEPAVADMKSQAGQAYRNIANRVLDRYVPIMDLNTGNVFVKRLKKLFGVVN